MTTEDLTEAIRQNADAPAEAASDGQRVKQHPLREQIEADRYLESKRAARSKGAGIKLVKLVPPGST